MSIRQIRCLSHKPDFSPVSQNWAAYYSPFFYAGWRSSSIPWFRRLLQVMPWTLYGQTRVSRVNLIIKICAITVNLDDDDNRRQKCWQRCFTNGRRRSLEFKRQTAAAIFCGTRWRAYDAVFRRREKVNANTIRKYKGSEDWRFNRWIPKSSGTNAFIRQENGEWFRFYPCAIRLVIPWFKTARLTSSAKELSCNHDANATISWRYSGKPNEPLLMEHLQAGERYKWHLCLAGGHAWFHDTKMHLLTCQRKRWQAVTAPIPRVPPIPALQGPVRGWLSIRVMPGDVDKTQRCQRELLRVWVSNHRCQIAKAKTLDDGNIAS